MRNWLKTQSWEQIEKFCINMLNKNVGFVVEEMNGVEYVETMETNVNILIEQRIKKNVENINIGEIKCLILEGVCVFYFFLFRVFKGF